MLSSLRSFERPLHLDMPSKADRDSLGANIFVLSLTSPYGQRHHLLVDSGVKLASPLWRNM